MAVFSATVNAVHRPLEYEVSINLGVAVSLAVQDDSGAIVVCLIGVGLAICVTALECYSVKNKAFLGFQNIKIDVNLCARVDILHVVTLCDPLSGFIRKQSEKVLSSG